MNGQEKEKLPFRPVDLRAMVVINAKVPRRLRRS